MTDATDQPPPATELTAEQETVAATMQAFADRTEKRIFERVEALNGSLDIETRDFEREAADHVVKVARGEVMEKVGWYVNVAKTGMPPFVPDPLWSRYVEVNLHPRTPHVGMVHATVYCAYFVNGTSTMAGYLDYVPGVWHDDDNARLQSALDAVYDRHGVDITRFRAQLGDSEFGKKHHRDALRAACVGISLYDPPFLPVTAENLQLAIDGFDAFVDTFFDLLDERKDQPVTAADEADQAGMRRRWLEDQLFADTYSMKVVPYEIWSFANQAPTVTF